MNPSMIEVKKGVMFGYQQLKAALPDIETALFFAKLYKLDAWELSSLLKVLFDSSSVIAALTGEGGSHSSELQDYLVEIGYEYLIKDGEVVLDGQPPAQADILPELWKSLEIEVAQSIQNVAEKLKDVVGRLPGKQGEMLFRSMMVLNAKRPVLGDYKALIHHAPKPDNLVVLDDSGSMTRTTVETLISDVVAMSYLADAHLAIVSNTTTVWAPGTFDVESVLAEAEYGGTHYETLAPLLQQDWGVVVTIADYDSSQSAMQEIAKCSGRIGLVLDISLVSRPTYLSEVVGQLAAEVRPLLIAADDRCCMGR